VRFRHVRNAWMLALLATSCSLGEPTEAGSLTLDVAPTPSTLSTDDEMSILVIARNVGFDPLTLTGPSPCLLYIEILSNQGQVVWSSNTSTVCGSGTVSEELSPGAELTRTFTWRGENLAGARLAAGFYHIRPVARLTPASYIGPVVTVALE
jgi:hypothetical protein